ncbi:cysteine desulfurase [Roseiterribacter gracilis]|uniref:cysteine desulfurase n=1 Tax=Roseiterribacter gracilis TaxID=2812848 RepID=A0A8S8X6U3_9PROT|nr:cysteine desulfurase [Rhodospirillales bacterium TMPK1]
MSLASIDPRARTPRLNRTVERIRQDFPILARTVHGKRLAYLDTAASAQKPEQVIEAMSRFQREEYANIHRGVYALSQAATDRFEAARGRVARFLNASSADEIVFTRNTTEAINVVAQSWARKNLKAGDEIVLTELEHHANIVPWQMIRAETGAVIKPIRIHDDGSLDLDHARSLIGPRTKLVAFAHVSNALGTVLPVRELVRLARAVDATVLIDGSQAVQHMAVDVQALDPDFYVFTGHKLYGPTGIGVLYGKGAVLNAMPPYQGGGDMIERVTFERTTFKPAPHRFEAGTPAITEAIGLAAAIDYVEQIGFDWIGPHEEELLTEATQALLAIDGLKLWGTSAQKASVLSFTLDGAHAHDVATILDQQGVAVRAGHHCAHPLMDRLGVAATSRASIGLYNDRADIDQLVAGITAVKRILKL